MTAEATASKIVAELTELEPWRRWHVLLARDIGTYVFVTEDRAFGQTTVFNYQIAPSVLESIQVPITQIASRIYVMQQQALRQIVDRLEAEDGT